MHTCHFQFSYIQSMANIAYKIPFPTVFMTDKKLLSMFHVHQLCPTVLGWLQRGIHV